MLTYPGGFASEASRPDAFIVNLLLLMGCVLLLLSMFFPTTYQQIRGVYLLLIFCAALTTWFVTGNTGLTKPVAILIVVFSIVGTAFVLLGLVRGAPGAHRVATVHVVWPLVYTVLISGLRSEKAFRWIMRAIVFGSIAISLYAFTFLLNFIGVLPSALYIEMDVGQGVVLYDGYVEFSMHSIATMVFAIPFLLSCLIVWPKQRAPLPRWLLWLAFFLAVCFAVLTARRALWLICGLTPFIIVGGMYFLSADYRSKNWGAITKRTGLLFLIAVLAMIALGSVFDIRIDGLMDYFWSALDIFTGSGGGSQHLRYEQFLALLESWQTRPVLGAGLGEGVGAIIRSNEQEWAYELSYLAILHQTGFVGFLSYGAGVAWIYFMAARIIRSNHWMGLYLFPTMTGLTAFLIANATNPYLAKFDFIWILFLPIGMINYWLLCQEARKGPNSLL